MTNCDNSTNENGYLEVIMGPMFSGKTTKLIEIYEKCIEKNIKVCALNFMLDKRYSNTMIASHDNKTIPCTFVTELKDVSIQADVDVILINEGQFFPDINHYVQYWVEELHKQVYIAALDGDFKRKPFGEFLNLLPLCDHVTKLQASCNLCKTNPAIFSHRISDEKEQVVIGGNNKYIPLCRKCYLASQH